MHTCAIVHTYTHAYKRRKSACISKRTYMYVHKTAHTAAVGPEAPLSVDYLGRADFRTRNE